MEGKAIVSWICCVTHGLAIVVWFYCWRILNQFLSICSASHSCDNKTWCCCRYLDYTWMMDLTIAFSKLHWLRRGRCSISHTFLNKWHGISDWLGTSWPQSYEIVQIRLISFISTFKAQSQFQCFAPLPQRTVTWGSGQNLPLWRGIKLWDPGPHTSSVVIDGIYINRCNHTNPTCCLQLCWFILCYHGNTVIISMSFAIYLIETEKHRHFSIIHSFKLSSNTSNNKGHCLIMSLLALLYRLLDPEYTPGQEVLDQLYIIKG